MAQFPPMRAINWKQCSKMACYAVTKRWKKFAPSQQATTPMRKKCRPLERFRSHNALLQPDFRHHRHPGPQPMLAVLALVQADAYRHALHHLDEIAGGIFRRKQAHDRPSGARHAFYIAVICDAERIHFDVRCLARLHSFELRLLEVGGDPNILKLADYQKLLASLDMLPNLDSLFVHHTANRRIYFCVR